MQSFDQEYHYWATRLKFTVIDKTLKLLCPIGRTWDLANVDCLMFIHLAVLLGINDLSICYEKC
jgi:hypothetical protein